MKNVFGFIFFLTVFATNVCLGQDNSQAKETAWAHIETENKELSVAFPADFLIDAKTDDFDQHYRVFGFENGVLLEMRITRPNNPKERLNQINVASSENLKLYSVLFNGIAGRHIVYKKTRYSSTLYLAYKDNFYKLSVSAPNEEQVEVDRFLCSIMIKDKPLFTCKKPLPKTNNKTVSLISLQTSPKVLEALNRESDGKEGKIFYQTGSYQSGTDENVGNDAKKDFSKRPAIVLNIPSAPKYTPPFSLREKIVIEIRVKLLANGQIGDVTLFAPVIVDRTSLRVFVDAARQTRFVPAELNGKAVDSETLVSYSYNN
jgi:hypothetical protein